MKKLPLWICIFLITLFVTSADYSTTHSDYVKGDWPDYWSINGSSVSDGNTIGIAGGWTSADADDKYSVDCGINGTLGLNLDNAPVYSFSLSSVNTTIEVVLEDYGQTGYHRLGGNVGASAFFIGISNDASNYKTYDTGNSWQARIARTHGNHTLKVYFNTSDSLIYYIDGVWAGEKVGLGASTYTDVQWAGSNTGNRNCIGYLLIYNGTVAPTSGVPAGDAPNVSVSSYSATNTTASNITGYCNVSDINNDTLNVTIYWLHDGAINKTWNITITNSNTTNELTDIFAAENLTAGNWSFRCKAADASLSTTKTGPIHDIIDFITPDISINSGNFFETDNSSIINRALSLAAPLNITLEDDYDLYAYEIYVFNESGTIVYNETNTTLSGKIQYIRKNITVNGSKGRYYINVTVSDSHTKTAIQDYKVDKGSDFLRFDNQIKVTAEGAVEMKATKNIDRYEIEANYPDASLKTKTFYVESDHPLVYVTSSGFQGHLVDYYNKKWIDFEGEGKVTVTKISDTKYMIEIKNSSKDKVKFKSIGGINTNSLTYSYFLVNPSSLDWTIPTTAPVGFINNNSINVSLSVTGYFRNTTTFYVYNASEDLLQTYQVSSSGNDTAQYNQYITGLTDSFYYINATHEDELGNMAYSDTLSIYAVFVDNCSASGNETMVFTIYREDIPSETINATFKIELSYWVNPDEILATYNAEFTDNYNYSICLTPATDAPVYSDVYVQYTTANGFTHRYYAYNTTLSNETQYITLYNFNTTVGISDLKITTRYTDTYNYFSNVIGLLQRRYIDEGVWRTVQMDQSGDYGLIFFNIIEENTDYRLIFKDRNNHILDTSESMKFICSSGICEITYRLDEWTATSTQPELGYNLQFDNNSGNITLTWNDPTGATSTTRLIVTKETSQRTVTICDKTKVGASGTTVCETSGYSGEVFVRVRSSASPEADIYSVWLQLTKPTLSSLVGIVEGSIWTMGIMTAVIGVGLAFGPAGAVIATVVGLIFIFYLGIFAAITATFVIIACILGIVIGLKVRNT